MSDSDQKESRTARLSRRFEILDEIGEGGFARVFRAKERETGRVVALKILRATYIDNHEVVERFKREIFAIASISSPYVVTLHDFGMSGHDVYLAMEYVKGISVREAIAEWTWNAIAVDHLISQVGQAIAAAHAQNISHRDLKPENVMLTKQPDGSFIAKVLDFGFAKLAMLERSLGLEELTRVNMCFGTPQYMSPEQFCGRPADHASDLFALAVMAYELIAGKLPWDDDDPAAVGRAVLRDPPPPISATDSSITRTAELDRFFGRALAKQPEQRPKNVAAFLKEFRIALLGADRSVGAASPASLDVDLDFEAETIPLGERRATPQINKKLASQWIPSLRDLSAMDATTVTPIPEGSRHDFKAFDPPSQGETVVTAIEPSTTARIPPVVPPRRGLKWALVPVALIVVVAISIWIGLWLGHQS